MTMTNVQFGPATPPPAKPKASGYKNRLLAAHDHDATFKTATGRANVIAAVNDAVERMPVGKPFTSANLKTAKVNGVAIPNYSKSAALSLLTESGELAKSSGRRGAPVAWTKPRVSKAEAPTPEPTPIDGPLFSVEVYADHVRLPLADLTRLLEALDR